MKPTVGTLQEGGASFATTHWSLVARSALTDVPDATDALARGVLASNLQLHPLAWLPSSPCTGPDAIIFRILLGN